MAVDLGEMDASLVNSYRSGQGEPPLHMAWFAPHWPAAVTQFRRATRGLSLTRWTTSTRPGLHRASGMGDGVWRGPKEGSVDKPIGTARKTEHRVRQQEKKRLFY